jgi:hypothetical protein
VEVVDALTAPHAASQKKSAPKASVVDVSGKEEENEATKSDGESSKAKLS